MVDGFDVDDPEQLEQLELDSRPENLMSRQMMDDIRAKRAGAWGFRVDEQAAATATAPTYIHTNTHATQRMCSGWGG